MNPRQTRETVFYTIISQNLVKLLSQRCPGCVDTYNIFLKIQLDVHFYKNYATFYCIICCVALESKIGNVCERWRDPASTHPML